MASDRSGTTLVRNTVHFGAGNLTMPLIVLFVYALIGIGLTVLAGGRKYSDTERELQLGWARPAPAPGGRPVVSAARGARRTHS